MPFRAAEFFRYNTELKKLLEFIESSAPEIFLSGLKGSAAAFFLSVLFQELRRTFLIVASSHDEALELYDELAFFSGREAAAGNYDAQDILVFPPLETHPYEHLATHPDVSGQRIGTLYQLCRRDRPMLVITCVEALLQKTLPRTFLLGACQQVRVNDEPDRDQLVRGLVECGYTRVSLVEDRGDMSIRGDVMDIFPPGYPRPLRISFFGDTVESIRAFDQVTQRSSAEYQEALMVPVKEAILNRETIAVFREQSAGAVPEKNVCRGPGQGVCGKYPERLFPGGHRIQPVSHLSRA